MNRSVPKTSLLIAITTCATYVDRQQAVRETWLRGPLPANIEVLFVLGDDDAFAAQRPARREGDVLILPVPEAYEFLPYKTWSLCRWVLAHSEHTHLMKCDDDSYVHIDRIGDIGLKRIDYAGRFTRFNAGISETWHYGKCRDKSYEVPFLGPYPKQFAEGFAYLLSRRACACVAKALENELRAHIYEDVFVGLCLQERLADIVKVDMKELFCVRNRKYALDQRILARHPLLPNEMRAFHQDLQSASHLNCDHNAS